MARNLDSRARAFRATSLKLGIFAVVMLLVFAGLVIVFSNYRGGKSADYSALFTSASAMQTGSKVKIAGVEVGSVDAIRLTPENTAEVHFSVDDEFALPGSVRALIRYENLTGDRYLELTQGQGGEPGENLARGGQIPLNQTEPALDLDNLLGGFKPLFRTLDHEEVNELSASLIEVFQGQGPALNQLLASTAEFTDGLADRDELIGSVIDNLNETLGTLDADRSGLDSSLDRLQQLVTGLSDQRETIGNALTQTSELTTDLADLLGATRPDIRDTVSALGRTSDELLTAEPYIRQLLQRLPEDYKILSNLGSYGAWLQLWLCRVRLMFDGPDGNAIFFNSIITDENTTKPGGRCYPR